MIDISSLFFQIISIFYIVLIAVAYFSKKKMHTLENRIYSTLIIVVFITLIIDCVSVSLGLVDPTSFITNLFGKLYLVCIIAWVFIFTYYIFVISFNKQKTSIMVELDSKEYVFFKKVFYIFLGLFALASIIILALPLHVYGDGKIMYTYGPSAIVSYSFAALCIPLWIVFVVSNVKEIRDKKYIPAFAFVVVAGTAAVIQSTFPEYLLVTAAATFITILTYFTIENPDMKMITQLNLAKEQADKANQAKSDFLSNMSHEIRTPLNAIVGFGQALSEEDLPPQAMSEVKDIMMASDNLLEIVNGILDISKIESGKLEIINKDYSFKKIFDEVVTLAKGRLGEKPLEFRVAYDESIPPVLFGDYSRIKEIMINLLTNAIKYTYEGYIELKVSSVIKDDICRIIISVEDSGIGIKQENINKLFTKFERLGVEGHATIEGTGLGLAITKKLLDLMNGQIVVQSVYGKGSRFTVAIDQKISVGHKLEDTASLDLTELETMDFSSKKVLVVDDNVINLKVAHRLLQEYKVQITEVQSGQAAIDLINAGNMYDLILMDDMMPKMSGVQTLQKLKTIPGFQMKVVALTANAITGMREKYLADGFDEYLAKPISKKELAKIIKKMLGN